MANPNEAWIAAATDPSAIPADVIPKTASPDPMHAPDNPPIVKFFKKWSNFVCGYFCYKLWNSWLIY